MALAALVLALILVSPILNGWALTILWGWFVVPIFGLPALSISSAIGLGLVVNLLTYQPVHDPRTNRVKAVEGVAWIIIRPTFPLLVGWIVVLVRH